MSKKLRTLISPPGIEGLTLNQVTATATSILQEHHQGKFQIGSYSPLKGGTAKKGKVTIRKRTKKK